jgi:hypothetical protein
MGMFDPASVKALNDRAGFIGGLVGDVYIGHLSDENARAMIQSDTQRAELRSLFDAAARDVGPDKALKKALNSAAVAVEVRADMSKLPRGDAPETARSAIREMLAPPAPAPQAQPARGPLRAQELNVPEVVAMEKQPDDPRWSLPAVAFLRDGSVVPLRGRSLREAHEEVRRAGDSDVYIDGITADALRNLGVATPD